MAGGLFVNTVCSILLTDMSIGIDGRDSLSIKIIDREKEKYFSHGCYFTGNIDKGVTQELKNSIS